MGGHLLQIMVQGAWGQASTAVVGAREPVAGGRGEPEGGKGVGEEQTTSKFLIGKVKGKEAK